MSKLQHVQAIDENLLCDGYTAANRNRGEPPEQILEVTHTRPIQFGIRHILTFDAVRRVAVRVTGTQVIRVQKDRAKKGPSASWA